MFGSVAWLSPDDRKQCEVYLRERGSNGLHSNSCAPPIGLPDFSKSSTPNELSAFEINFAGVRDSPAPALRRFRDESTIAPSILSHWLSAIPLQQPRHGAKPQFLRVCQRGVAPAVQRITRSAGTQEKLRRHQAVVGHRNMKRRSLVVVCAIDQPRPFFPFQQLLQRFHIVVDHGPMHLRQCSLPTLPHLFP